MIVPVLKWVRYGSLILVVAVLGFVGRHALFQDIPRWSEAPSPWQGEGKKTVTDLDFRGLWTLVFFSDIRIAQMYVQRACKRLVMLCGSACF